MRSRWLGLVPYAEAEALQRAIHEHSPDARKLLALRFEAGLDSSEIGTLEGRPAATIRWQLARLIARLRKELADA